jgi:hypothetical protein
MVDTYLQEIRLLTRIVKVKPKHAEKLGISEDVLKRLSSDGAHIDLKGYITLSEASRKFPISRVTLHTWARRGYLGTPVRTSKEVFFNESRIAKLVEVVQSEGGAGKRCVSMYVTANPA